MWYVVGGMWGGSSLHTTYDIPPTGYVVCGRSYVGKPFPFLRTVCDRAYAGRLSPHTIYDIPHTGYAVGRMWEVFPHLPHTTYHLPGMW